MGESHYYYFASLDCTLLTTNPMSKQPNVPPPGDEHPTKRFRKMAGFQFAHPQPSISQLPSASSSSLFVTISTDSRRRGVTSESHAAESASNFDTQSILDPAAAGDAFEAHTVLLPEEVGPSPETRSRRKRYTKNAVRSYLEWNPAIHSDFQFSGSTERIA